MGELAVMGKAGDTKLIWGKENEAEVSNARRTFDDLKKKGFAAFSVKTNGDKGTQVDSFDPDAERIILVPPMIGG